MDKGHFREMMRSWRMCFSAVLVILVSKKCGSWRMCFSCRVINNRTVKCRHHIPHLNDMLDEFHGACFLSKIDLKSGYP